MLKAYMTLNGKLKEIPFENAAKELAGKTRNCMWIDATEPNASELNDLSKLMKIPVEDLNMCLDEEERPRIEEAQDYHIIFYRAPYVHREESDIEILTSPIGIFLTRDCVLTVHLHHTRYLEMLVEHAVPIESPPLFSLRIITEITSRYFKVLDKLDEDLENLEEEIFESPDKKTVEKIFDARKTLLFFHKSLTANREVLVAIEKGYIPSFDKKTREKFRDIYTETIQLIDMAATYREILTGALDIYLSTISNNLNKVVKVLTILTAMIMIPTLIAGVYGMNVRLPYAEHDYGFWVVLLLMLASVGASMFVFKKRNWI